MSQEIQRPIEHAGSPGGAGSIFDQEDNRGGMATVASGPYAEQLPVGGLSVGEIRTRFRNHFDINPQSQAVLDGQDAGDETVVRTGQMLMFVHRAGEKG